MPEGEIREATAELAALVEEYFPPAANASSLSVEPLGLDDQAVLDIIFRSKQAAKFDGLWRGDTSAYGGDDSAADMALCAILAFYCDGPEQVERIFRSSGLMRDKWDSRRGDSTYGALTVAKAWAEQREHYTAPASRSKLARASSNGSKPPAPEDTSGLVLPWLAPSEVMAIVPEKPDYVINGMIIRGAVTELDAKIKAGKTTMLAYMIRAVIRGTPIFGQPTKPARFVILTEEGVETIKEWLAEVGLGEADDFIRIVSFRDPDVQRVIEPLGWAEVVALVAKQARDFGAAVLLIDTLSKWARIPGDEENSSGVAAEAMTPLEFAAAGEPRLAVWVNRHDRKAGGEVGESGRGSSAFGGSSDIIFQLRRANTEGHPNRRILVGVGRYRDIPAEMTIELVDGEYIAIGGAKEVERADAKVKLLDHLPGPGATALTEEEILQRLPELSRSTFARARNELMEAGDVERVTGLGKTGRAFGYRLAGDPSNRLPH